MKNFGREEIRRALDGLEAGQVTRELAPDDYPVFATIDDPANPHTLKQVDPHHLDRAFASGVSLKAISLSVTDEPITAGKTGAVLGQGFFKIWQAQFEEAFRKSGPFGQRPFAFQISRNDFVAGD
ncbi:hypothetical protein [Ensifer canadensis]